MTYGLFFLNRYTLGLKPSGAGCEPGTVNPFFSYEEDIAPYKGELEIWYVRNQTIRLDLLLSILTLLVIVFPGIERHTQLFKAVPQKPAQILELYGSYKSNE